MIQGVGVVLLLFLSFVDSRPANDHPARSYRNSSRRKSSLFGAVEKNFWGRDDLLDLKKHIQTTGKKQTISTFPIQDEVGHLKPKVLFSRNFQIHNKSGSLKSYNVLSSSGEYENSSKFKPVKVFMSEYFNRPKFSNRFQQTNRNKQARPSSMIQATIPDAKTLGIKLPGMDDDDTTGTVVSTGSIAAYQAPNIYTRTTNRLSNSIPVNANTMQISQFNNVPYNSGRVLWSPQVSNGRYSDTSGWNMQLAETVLTPPSGHVVHSLYGDDDSVRLPTGLLMASSVPLTEAEAKQNNTNIKDDFEKILTDIDVHRDRINKSPTQMSGFKEQTGYGMDFQNDELFPVVDNSQLDQSVLHNMVSAPETGKATFAGQFQTTTMAVPIGNTGSFRQVASVSNNNFNTDFTAPSTSQLSSLSGSFSNLNRNIGNIHNPNNLNVQYMQHAITNGKNSVLGGMSSFGDAVLPFGSETNTLGAHENGYKIATENNHGNSIDNYNNDNLDDDKNGIKYDEDKENNENDENDKESDDNEVSESQGKISKNDDDVDDDNENRSKGNGDNVNENNDGDDDDDDDDNDDDEDNDENLNRADNEEDDGTGDGNNDDDDDDDNDQIKSDMNNEVDNISEEDEYNNMNDAVDDEDSSVSTENENKAGNAGDSGEDDDDERRQGKHNSNEDDDVGDNRQGYDVSNVDDDDISKQDNDNSNEDGNNNSKQNYDNSYGDDDYDSKQGIDNSDEDDDDSNQDNDNSNEDDDSKQDNDSSNEDDDESRQDNHDSNEDDDDSKQDNDNSNEDDDDSNQDNDNSNEDDDSKQDNDSSNEDDDESRQDNHDSNEDDDDSKQDNDNSNEDDDDSKQDNDNSNENNDDSKQDNDNSDEDDDDSKQDNDNSNENDDDIEESDSSNDKDSNEKKDSREENDGEDKSKEEEADDDDNDDSRNDEKGHNDVGNRDDDDTRQDEWQRREQRTSSGERFQMQRPRGDIVSTSMSQGSLSNPQQRMYSFMELYRQWQYRQKLANSMSNMLRMFKRRPLKIIRNKT